MRGRAKQRGRRGVVLTTFLVVTLLVPTAAFGDPQVADAPTDDQDIQQQFDSEGRDPAATLEAQDALAEATHRDRRHGRKFNNLRLKGRGERQVGQATTDVWAHGRYAYIGTFNEPCGTGENFTEEVAKVELVDDVEAPGVAVFDVRNTRKPRHVGNLPSVEGSRSNDVKVERMNSGTILAHSNEACAGGHGGIELYDVSKPRRPTHLASIRIDELNPLVDELFGPVTDVGVHNIFLFSQGDRDYVSVVAETIFDNFQTFDITDPTSPELVSAWGAEELSDPGVGDETEDDVRVQQAVLDWLAAGFGTSENRFLHDITYDLDGTTAYLSNWDAGLVRMNMSDPEDPQVVSVALDPEEGSLDGEVNSHAAWPNEDGTVVVETEEDFDAFEFVTPPGNLTFGDEDPDAPLPGTAISTEAGDDFESNQTGNTGTVTGDEVTVNEGPLAGNTYRAIEFAGDQPEFPEEGLTGELVYVGQLCDVDEPLNPDAIDEGDIAVARRGACAFREKNFNAADLGAAAIVIANNLRENTPWGGVRIWDYSDPENPVLASTFNTECSAEPEPTERCDAAGTWSVHNVIVETRGKRTLAYLSWYWDGMLVLDVTDPYNPKEIARFFDDSPEFIEDNGGNPHDFWGVYKARRKPTIYGSDRNGGLYLFRLGGRR